MSSFNTSARKDDTSLKLRAQNRSNNIKMTRDQTKRLEDDNRKMEERLRELKNAMNKEKEERERQGGGFWGRGQSSKGSLTKYASEVLTKSEKPAKEKKKKIVKVLHDEPLDIPQRPNQPGTMKYISQRKLTANTTPRDKQKGPKCGQCEDRTATLNCIQCAEIYCAGCFAAFHLKGALKQHRSTPLAASGNRVCMSPQLFSPRGSHASGVVVTKSNSYSDGSEASGPANQTRSSLLNGSYDESQSAASFQAALKAWRQGETTVVTNKMPSAPVHRVDEGTDMIEDRSSVAQNIKFKSTLSYAEKLMLKGHRRTELVDLDTPRSRDKNLRGSLSDESVVLNRNQADVFGSFSLGDATGSHTNERTREDTVDLEDEERVDFSSLLDAMKSSVSSASENERGQSSDFSIQEIDSIMPSDRKKEDYGESKCVVEEVGDFESWQIEQTNSSSRRKPSYTDNPLYYKPTREVIMQHRKEVNESYRASSPSRRPLPLAEIEEMYKSPPMMEFVTSNTGNVSSSSSSSSILEQNYKRPVIIDDSFETYGVFYEADLVMRVESRKESDFPSCNTESNLTKEVECFTEEPKDKENLQSCASRPNSQIKKRNSSNETKPKGNKSRSSSRTQSRTGSKLRPPGLLTKSPSKALKTVANMSASAQNSYQPLGEFFLAGVELKPETQIKRTITPSAQRSNSRSSRPGSARGDKSDVKVSNKLYKMAPKSWRPESSLGETVPLQNVEPDGPEMVLNYSYSGQVTGQPTEWRPSPSLDEDSSNQIPNTAHDSRTNDLISSRLGFIGDEIPFDPEFISQLPGSEKHLGQGDSEKHVRPVIKSNKTKQRSLKKRFSGSSKIKYDENCDVTFQQDKNKSNNYPVTNSDESGKSDLDTKFKNLSGNSTNNSYKDGKLPNRQISFIEKKSSKRDSTTGSDSRPASSKDVSRSSHDASSWRPNSCHVTNTLKRSGSNPVITKDKSPKGNNSIEAEIISSKRREDNWMESDGKNIDSENNETILDNDLEEELPNSARWNTEVRPFSARSVDISANISTKENQSSLRATSNLSGRISKAIVMDGDDLSQYDELERSSQREQEDKQTLESLEWELASESGRITADGQISRMNFIEDNDEATSPTQVNYGKSEEFDVIDYFKEEEKLAEQNEEANDNTDTAHDEQEVRALS